MPQRARDDLRALQAVDVKFQVRALEALTDVVNNSYLQSQGVELGVGDYERGYTLFVLAYQLGLVELPPPLPRSAPATKPRTKPPTEPPTKPPTEQPTKPPTKPKLK